ncbi:hypothetical protein B0O80DRAFT_186361 [Mortierella sp. GBAus27b]|nr:hypothetical protein B0O80DRAFT_186361 [Mortierella sp. GBAus27b]
MDDGNGSMGIELSVLDGLAKFTRPLIVKKKTIHSSPPLHSFLFLAPPLPPVHLTHSDLTHPPRFHAQYHSQEEATETAGDTGYGRRMRPCLDPRTGPITPFSCTSRDTANQQPNRPCPNQRFPELTESGIPPYLAV